MSNKRLRVLHVTGGLNKPNPLIEHLKYLKSIGADVEVVDDISGVNARKIGGKSFEYIIVDEVRDNEL